MDSSRPATLYPLPPTPYPFATPYPHQFGGNLVKDDMDNLQRLAGNCELRSIVMCAPGID